MPLAVVTRSGTTPSWSQANHDPVRQKPGLDLVGDEHDAVVLRPGGEGRQEAGRGLDEAALAEDRLDRDARQVGHADLLVEVVDRAGGRLLAGQAVAERVRHRRAVDLGGERAEAVLVRHVLRRHRHRQVGAAVVGVVEHAHRVAAGRDPGDLDGVLDGLGAGVEQRALLGVVARGQLGEGLAHLDVAGVRRDHEAGVGEGRDLVGHRRGRPPGPRCRPRPRRCRSRGRSASCRRRRPARLRRPPR